MFNIEMCLNIRVNKVPSEVFYNLLSLIKDRKSNVTFKMVWDVFT